MNQPLADLVELQQLDSAAEQARLRIAVIPDISAALEARLAEREEAVAQAKAALTDSQTRRRAVEKDLAVVQGRLSKYRDQLMAVKTNKEYTAMQTEIGTAEREVGAFEEQIIALLLEADEHQAAVKAAEAALEEERGSIAGERQALEQEGDRLERRIEELAEARHALVARMDRTALNLFEHVARSRRGLAVVEARNGHCSVCNVRLRPQVFNEVRRNDTLIQCESCQRILYFPK
jgi:predicted  nucleic acid-binding Zn-ribbon protein